MSGIDIQPDALESRLEQLRRRNHPNCILCSANDGLGLGVEFAVTDDGGVAALVECDRLHQGYTGILHGGIVALLLDGAMTNCLFAAGVTAVTAEMSVRYLSSATTDKPMQVTARITHSRPPLYLLHSEMHQEGVLVARASGKFMTP